MKKSLNLKSFFESSKPTKDYLKEGIMNELAIIVEEWVNHELYSFYLYEQLAFVAGLKGLENFQKLFEKQAREELSHFQRAKEFSIAKNIPLTFQPILPMDNPLDVTTPCIDLILAALEAENNLTDFFNSGISTSREVGNDMGFEEMFLQFAKEQVEEVDYFQTLADRVSQLSPEAVILYDQELEIED